MEHVVQEQKASVENMKPPVQSPQRCSGEGGGEGGLGAQSLSDK